MLKSLFEIVLFEDTGNQWSLSRPMLSLILISEQVMSTIWWRGSLSLSCQPVFLFSFFIFRKRRCIFSISFDFGKFFFGPADVCWSESSNFGITGLRRLESFLRHYWPFFYIIILNFISFFFVTFNLQPVDQQQRLSACFDKLMADVTMSLESKNRDKFTQNLTVFRHDFRVK